MAMEKVFAVSETHTRPVTAVGYSQARREILLGCEDGVVKMLESDTGKLVNVFYEHKGWVTDFVYWADTKVVISSGNDGLLVVWGSGGGVSDKIQMGQPVYCLALNLRRKQIICGMHSCLRVYDLDEDRESGHYVNLQVKCIAKNHTDIVRCVVHQDTRVYSAGYDQQLVIYESSYAGSLKPVIINHSAHKAGICCLILVKDTENNTWCVTGSFDKVVKIWSIDGKLIHKLDGFAGMVSGLCYVQRSKMIWVAAGAANAYLFDPKSGDNISDFFGTSDVPDESKSPLQLIRYFPESNQAVATTSRQSLIVWKYNVSGCISTLRCSSAVESIAYTRMSPILLFTGDSEGNVTKWERTQANHFIYSRETLLLSDALKAKRRRKKEKEKHEFQKAMQEEEQEQQRSLELKRKREPKSHYAYLSRPTTAKPLSTEKKSDIGIVSIVFVEELDLMVAACEDANIYVWGFDENAMEALKKMEPQVKPRKMIPKEYEILLNRDSLLFSQRGDNRVKTDERNASRVAGFICRHIFSEHQSCVTSLAVVTRDDGWDGTYVVSAGWDRRICIWDMEEGGLKDVFRNPSDVNPPTTDNNQTTTSTTTTTTTMMTSAKTTTTTSSLSLVSASSSVDKVEIACDGIIHDLTYSATRNEIAYASSDWMVYIRKFSTNGCEMTLVNTLQGHDGEVMCVKWNGKQEKWISGSEDGTVRIWSSVGLNECEQILSTQGPVSSMCIDIANGAIVVGIQNNIRVYDSEQYKLVQTNIGHTDVVQSLLHVPERGQYVSSSWDKTVRIWNAWKPNVRKTKFSQDQVTSAADVHVPPPPPPVTPLVSFLLTTTTDDQVELSPEGASQGKDPPPLPHPPNDPPKQ